MAVAFLSLPCIPPTPHPGRVAGSPAAQPSLAELRVAMGTLQRPRGRTTELRVPRADSKRLPPPVRRLGHGWERGHRPRFKEEERGSDNPVVGYEATQHSLGAGPGCGLRAARRNSGLLKETG